MLPEPFERALKKAPIAVMARAILERLFDPETLDKLFKEQAQKQYSRKLLFSSVVELMMSVVLGTSKSVLSAFRARKDILKVSDEAVYNKLQNMEIGVSAALVSYSAQEAEKIINGLNARKEPLFANRKSLIIDGNGIEHTHHRIKETRELDKALLPGKALVVLDPETGLAIRAFLTPDGHAQERSLFDQVLEMVQPEEVWIADRNFCTFNFLTTIAKKGAFYVIRQHGSINEILDGERILAGEASTGKIYEQSNSFTYEGATSKIRRITVELNQPTKDKETEIHIFTNLPVEISAMKIADSYQKRWTIEGLFLEIKKTLQCEINELCYPNAALFVLCMALMASNAVAILKAVLRSVHGSKAVNQTSGYYMAWEMKIITGGMMIFLPEEEWLRFQTMSLDEFIEILKYMASFVKMEKYKKNNIKPDNPNEVKKPRAKPKQRTKTKIETNTKKGSNHESTYKILLGRNS